MLTDKVSG